jgi:predicted enzyme related to lactoylglutathione lyase
MSDVYPDYPDVVLAMVIVDSVDPERLAAFYGELLGRRVSHRDGTYVGLEWSPRFGAGLVFQKVADPTPGKNRVHVDIICSDIEATAKRAEELGAGRADDYPKTEYVIVMRDPEDNVFCLVPPPGG